MSRKLLLIPLFAAFLALALFWSQSLGPDSTSADRPTTISAIPAAPVGDEDEVLATLVTSFHALPLTDECGAVAAPAVAAVDEVQTVTLAGGGTADTFTLTVPTVPTVTTGALAGDGTLTAAALDTALEAAAAPSVVFTVVGATGGPYTVTFTGSLAGTNIAPMTATVTDTAPAGPFTVTIATTTDGAPAVAAVLAGVRDLGFRLTARPNGVTEGTLLTPLTTLFGYSDAATCVSTGGLETFRQSVLFTPAEGPSLGPRDDFSGTATAALQACHDLDSNSICEATERGASVTIVFTIQPDLTISGPASAVTSENTAVQVSFTGTSADGCRVASTGVDPSTGASSNNGAPTFLAVTVGVVGGPVTQVSSGTISCSGAGELSRTVTYLPPKDFSGTIPIALIVGSDGLGTFGDSDSDRAATVVNVTIQPAATPTPAPPLPTATPPVAATPAPPAALPPTGGEPPLSSGSDLSLIWAVVTVVGVALGGPAYWAIKRLRRQHLR